MPDSQIHPPSRQGRTDWGLIALLYAAGALAAFQYAKIAHMLPGLTSQNPLTSFQQAVVLSTLGVAGAVAGTFAGALCTAFGLRRTLLVGLALAAVGALAPLLASGFYPLLLARAVESVAHMAIVVSVPTLMLMLCADHHRAKIMVLWSCYFTATFIVTAVLAPVLLDAAGWRGLALAHVALLVVVGLLCLRGVALPTIEAQPARLSSRAVLHSQWRLLSQGRLLAIPATFLGYTLLFVALVSALPGWLAHTPSARAWLALALPGASLVGTVIALHLLGRGVAGHRMVRATAAGLLLTALGLALLTPQGLAARAVVLALFVLLGVLPAGIVSSVPAVFQPADPDVALVNGGLVQFGNLGNFVGAPILALLWGVWGWAGAGLYVGAGALVVWVCLQLLRRYARG